MPVSDPIRQSPWAEPVPPPTSSDPYPESPVGRGRDGLPLTDHLAQALGGEPDLPDVPGYQVLEVVGRGGMGTVYRAVHLAPAREVALKLIYAGGPAEAAARRRFEREVRALARIEHPNVVPIYDVGAWRGFPFYTTKFVPGGALERHLGRLRADLGGGCRVLAKVARAVHRVHGAGVVHRDLKPGNILLDAGDEPLVADFGLALGAGDGPDLTASGFPLGTRQFMAPEQTTGRKAEYGPGTDVWALGVVLYQLVTGRHPFEDGDGGDLYRRIRESDPPPPGALNSACPPGLGAVVARCLAKRPGDRYPTAAALADDLDRCAAGLRPGAAGARRPFGSAVLLAGVLAAAAGGVALVGPRAPRAEPPAARLARGEPVELIGPTGGPLVGPHPVPGAAGVLSTDRDGFCTLDRTRLAAVDLVRERLPGPVRLEAEVALSRGDGPGSWAAVYAGRGEYAGADGPAGAQAQVTLWRTLGAPRAGAVAVTDDLSAEAFWWAPGAAGARAQAAKGVAVVRSERAAFPLPLAWHRVSLVLTPDRAVAEAGGRALGAVRADALHELGAGFGRRGWAPHGPVPPGLGPGLGIAVNNAEATFRNVRLVPIAPAPAMGRSPASH